jgi:hypothetical protein
MVIMAAWAAKLGRPAADPAGKPHGAHRGNKAVQYPFFSVFTGTF